MQNVDVVGDNVDRRPETGRVHTNTFSWLAGRHRDDHRRATTASRLKGIRLVQEHRKGGPPAGSGQIGFEWATADGSTRVQDWKRHVPTRPRLERPSRLSRSPFPASRGSLSSHFPLPVEYSYFSQSLLTSRLRKQQKQSSVCVGGNMQHDRVYERHTEEEANRQGAVWLRWVGGKVAREQ